MPLLVQPLYTLLIVTDGEKRMIPMCVFVRPKEIDWGCPATVYLRRLGSYKSCNSEY